MQKSLESDCLQPFFHSVLHHTIAARELSGPKRSAFVLDLTLTSVQKEFPHLKAWLRWRDEFRKCTLLFLIVDKQTFVLYNQYVRR